MGENLMWYMCGIVVKSIESIYENTMRLAYVRRALFALLLCAYAFSPLAMGRLTLFKT